MEESVVCVECKLDLDKYIHSNDCNQCDICNKVWCMNCQTKLLMYLAYGNSGDYCDDCYKIKDSYLETYKRKNKI